MRLTSGFVALLISSPGTRAIVADAVRPDPIPLGIGSVE
jgi:hypothetical protein